MVGVVHRMSPANEARPREVCRARYAPTADEMPTTNSSATCHPRYKAEHRLWACSATKKAQNTTSEPTLKLAELVCGSSCGRWERERSCHQLRGLNRIEVEGGEDSGAAHAHVAGNAELKAGNPWVDDDPVVRRSSCEPDAAPAGPRPGSYVGEDDNGSA
eukprot:scaffold9156_cov120-Isochrysis_galbana.AAC.3